MKKKRYTEEQIVRILREWENGAKIDDLCRKHGVSAATFHRWKGKYAGMDLSDLKKMKAMESENSQLKRIVADQALQISAMKDVLSKKW